jgi:hypothetical protein
VSSGQIAIQEGSTIVVAVTQSPATPIVVGTQGPSGPPGTTGPVGPQGPQGPAGMAGAASGIACDFRRNGTLYFTPASTLDLSAQSVLTGSGSSGAIVSYAVDGAPMSLPFTVAAGQELAITLLGMTDAQRASFSVG